MGGETAHWPLFMGAEALPKGGTRFRVWASMAGRVDLELHRSGHHEYHAMDPEGEGLFSAEVPQAGPGTHYKFRLDGQSAFPDPYSRCQPRGVHGPSEVIDPRDHLWHDLGWSGIGPAGLVIYECHVGTYTPAGTFEALIDQLPELRLLGVNALELMPVAEFAGRRNWGYDGVDLFAPTLNYGGPTGLKRLVDAAHQQGLAVLLDVVYNHLGPAGNYLRAFAPQYFTDRYPTPWGEALNFDGQASRWVRHYVIQNACYWLNEFHIDGLRLDATHAIFDRSPLHILTEITVAARASVGQSRQVVIIAEDGNNDVSHIRPVAAGGHGLDAVWADDFHHALRSFLTGDRDGYFADYTAGLPAVARTLQQGFYFQGEVSRYFGRPRGTRVADEPARAFVFCLQNHDQVGNRAFGDRLNHAIDRDSYLVATALLLLAPETPLIFMGQEFAASTPFQYFTDHEPALGKLVTEGRRGEFRSFAAFSDPALRYQIPDPQAEETFTRSKLDLLERRRNAGVYRCYRDLLRLRRRDPVFRVQDRLALRASDLHDRFLAVHRATAGEHRLLLANFGEALAVSLTSSLPFADLPSLPWRLIWSSSSPRYWDVSPAQPALVAGHEPLPHADRPPFPTHLDLPRHCAVLLAARQS